MKIFLAVNHPEIESALEKLESEKGIKELGKSIGLEGLSHWAKPILIVDEAMYRERLIEKARAAEPDVLILYDKLPGVIDLDILLEEIRLEVKTSEQKDTRIVFLTSLEQGAPLLRKAVELGIWDIISGKDILLIDLIVLMSRLPQSSSRELLICVSVRPAIICLQINLISSVSNDSLRPIFFNAPDMSLLCLCCVLV